MRSLIILFLTYVALFGLTFVDESQYSKNIVGSKNLKGAKFLGETIWQDQPINEKINYMSLDEANEYCKNLKLLGIKKWRLPLKSDFMILDDEKRKLRYIAKGCDGFGYCPRRNEYYTQTINKKAEAYIADLDNGKYPYITRTKYIKEKRAVRCVLNPNIYNQYQLQKAKKLLQKKSLENYLEAFLATKNRDYLKKAIKIAKTKKEKAKIEATLFKFLGFFKIFDIVANGEIIGKESKNTDTNNRLLAGMSKSKSLKYRFQIRLKKGAALKLKYNTYNVKLEFNLKIKYRVIAFGIGTTKREFLRKKVNITLSPKNGYKSDIMVDFGEIEQGRKARFLVISASKKLEKVTLTYEVDDVKIGEHR